MNADVFLDTNILFYAHDLSAGSKHAVASALVERLWNRREMPCVSVQVLQELHVNLVRKGTPEDRSGQIASRYLSWRVVDNTRNLFQQALSEQTRWQVSFWDALILAAARRAGVSMLWSEDFSNGQDYGGVRVVNPLTDAHST